MLVFKLAHLMVSAPRHLDAISQAHAQDKPPDTGKTKSTAKTDKVVASKDAAKKKAAPSAPKSATPAPSDIKRPRASENRILERLAERRQTLEKRARALELRENLIKAAEQKIEARIKKLKAIEARIEKTFAGQDKRKAAQLKSLVSMYENMKPKDAARIFNRLDMRVLIDVAEQMNTRKMAPVLALMDSAAAERLTLELVARARGRAARAPTAKKATPDGKG